MAEKEATKEAVIDKVYCRGVPRSCLKSFICFFSLNQVKHDLAQRDQEVGVQKQHISELETQLNKTEEELKETKRALREAPNVKLKVCCSICESANGRSNGNRFAQVAVDHLKADLATRTDELKTVKAAVAVLRADLV